MSALAKVFVVFVFLLSILFFGTSAPLYLTREDWATNYDTYKAAVEVKVSELEKNNSDLKGERNDLQDALRLVSEDELDRPARSRCSATRSRVRMPRSPTYQLSETRRSTPRRRLTMSTPACEARQKHSPPN